MDYDELFECLKNAGNDTRCRDLIKWLESVGFKVRKRNNGNHYTFTHKGLAEAVSFRAGRFSGDHGSQNPLVKTVYIRKIIKIVSDYETELRTYLGETI